MDDDIYPKDLTDSQLELVELRDEMAEEEEENNKRFSE